MRRLLVLALSATFVFAFESAPAQGCSCALQDPAAMLETSDAAFVGTLSEAPETTGVAIDVPVVWVFDVEEWVKGDLGDTVGVHSGLGGGDCGFELQVGDQIGVFLYNEDGRPTSGLCSTTTPDGMRLAGQPLVFDGSGPPVFVLAGASGRTRLVTLDAEGRLLAAAGDQGFSFTASVCPGGDAVVEVVDGEAVVHRTSDLEVVAVLPGGAGEVELSQAWCVDPAGDTVIGVLVDWARNTARVADLADPSAELASGPAEGLGQAVVSGATMAFQDRAGRGPITILDLASGDQIEVPGYADVSRLAFSPDGTRLLVARTVQRAQGWDLGITVLDTADGSVLTEIGPLAEAEAYGWVGDGAVAVGAYDAQGNGPFLSRVELASGDTSALSAPGYEFTAVDGGIVSVDQGTIWFTPDGGEPTRLTGLPSEAHRIAAVLDTPAAPDVTAATTPPPSTTAPPVPATVPTAAPTDDSPGPWLGWALGGGAATLVALGAWLALRRRQEPPPG